MLRTLMFSVVAVKSRISSVSYVQLMSRCARAGKENSQTASPSWPVEMFHNIDGMLNLSAGFGWGAGLSLCFFCEFKSSLGWEFELFREFNLFWAFHNILEIHYFWVL